MNSRHRGRRLALQGLCCLDVQGQAALDLVDDFLEDSREAPATISSARKLLGQTFATRENIDQILARHARHWDLGRLALVDRNILRMSVLEMQSGTTPFKVIISEALRLAQEFSTAESPRFINGVLDAIARQISKEQPPDKSGRPMYGGDREQPVEDADAEIDDVEDVPDVAEEQ